ncbi:hypothetical protein AVEN_72162-1, partial [Araneus ventricosus]
TPGKTEHPEVSGRGRGGRADAPHRRHPGARAQPAPEPDGTRGRKQEHIGPLPQEGQMSSAVILYEKDSNEDLPLLYPSCQ